MSYHKLTSVIVLCVLLVPTLQGCGDSGIARKHVDPASSTSLIDYFKDVHRHTETPNGKVDMSTAKAIDQNTIEYKTQDGSQFRITGTVDHDLGGVKWDTPKKLTD